MWVDCASARQLSDGCHGARLLALEEGQAVVKRYQQYLVSEKAGQRALRSMAWY
jgi:hypothetical protein